MNILRTLALVTRTTPSNTRVQRTRSSPSALRSPLTRHPLGVYGRMSQFLTPAVLTLFLPLVSAVVASVFERTKERAWDQFVRKERTIGRFSEPAGVSTPIRRIEVRRRSFLTRSASADSYCPDDVIRKAYAFLSTAQTGAHTTDSDRRQAFGELALAIRMDLLSRRLVTRTDLTPADFPSLQGTLIVADP